MLFNAFSVALYQSTVSGLYLSSSQLELLDINPLHLLAVYHSLGAENGQWLGVKTGSACMLAQLSALVRENKPVNAVNNEMTGTPHQSNPYSAGAAWFTVGSAPNGLL